MSEPHATARRSIADVGAGNVGLVSAVGLASLGHAIELVETNRERLVALGEGRVPFTKQGVQEALTAAIAARDLTILDRVSKTTSEIVLICVGTPIDDRGHADMRAVEAVTGTDDIRYSPAVQLARWPLGHDAIVHAYDPAAGGHGARALPGLIVHPTALEALTGAEAP